MYGANDLLPSTDGASSSRPSSYFRTSLGSGGGSARSPTDDPSHPYRSSSQTSQTQTKRNSKACENCRARRVKCQGGQPCVACVEVGMGDRCAVRAKARPNRVPKVASDLPRRSEELAPATSNPAAFVMTVQRVLEAWAAGKGYPMSFALSDSFPLRASYTRPLPPIQVDHARDNQHMEGFKTMLHYFDFIPAAQLQNILHRYHSTPELLDYDEQALLYACLCLGRYREITMTDLATSERTDADYFRRAVLRLDQCTKASYTSLRALHCLHMHSMRAGGVSETRDILGRMATQVRELGLQRDRAIKQHAEEEKLEKMLFGTIYKDSWYATICDQAPFLRWSEIDHDLSVGDNEVTDLDRGVEAVPFLVQLTVFENDLLSRLHAGSSQPITTEYVLDTEARWDKWTKAFREEQEKVSRPMLYIYANIRFHWLRLMLRFPCLNNPYLAQSSLAILARSVSHILQSYSASAAIQRFTASWPDLRRIVTSGQLSVLLYDQGEVIKPELENTLQTMFGLLAELQPLCPMASDATTAFRQIVRILRLTVRMPNGEDATTPQADLPFLFDYSLPPPFEQWIYPMPSDGTTTQDPTAPQDPDIFGSRAASATRPDFPSTQQPPSTSQQFITDPNEAAAYLQLLASLHAAETFPGLSQV